MLFGTKTRPISDFLPRITIHIEGIDTDMVASYIADAIVQFLRDTKCLTEIVCLELEPCVNSYKLNTKNRIIEVKSVRFYVGGVRYPTHNFQFRIDGDILYVQPCNVCGKVEVEVELVTNLSRDMEYVPEFIYEDWVEAITHLTLANLYQQTDNDWYNPTAANNRMTQYQQLVNKAMFSNVTKHKPFQMRLSNKRSNG